MRSKKARRGFSLVEVLLAMFILGIGMIMVASVFPVGANWTRQTTEESVAQTVVQNALTVIKTHYGPGGNLNYLMNADYLTLNAGGVLVANSNNGNTILNPGYLSPPPYVLQALPGFVPDSRVNSPGIPLSERAYQFGSSKPFPADNIKNCTYFWTALARVNPAHRDLTWNGTDVTNGVIPSPSYNYDIYILVFRKGSVEQQFSTAGPTNLGAEIPGTRNMAGSVSPNDVDGWSLLPSVASASYAPGTYVNGAWTQPALPAIGQNGIGRFSGTVFKQILNTTTFGGAQPRPGLTVDSKGNPEPIIFSPAADGTVVTASPLIYIYQTTMTF
jgi:prepilin-type N-terminal cleavage/methylation domain-containing protein